MGTPRIQLLVEHADGRCFNAEVAGASITADMLEAVEDLHQTLKSGVRALPKDLYDVCSRAFGVSRESAKKRILGAVYNAKSAPKPEPSLTGWSWQAHLDDLLEAVRDKRWLSVTRKLALMLGHAIDQLPHEDGKAEKP